MSIQIGFDAKRLFNNFTGLGNYSRFVLEALLEYYPENTYWLYSPSYRKSEDIGKIVAHPRVCIKHPVPWMRALRLQSYWRSVSLGRTASRDGIDVFHGLSNELPLLRSSAVKTVVTIHDVIFKRYPQFYNTIDTRIYTSKVSRACRIADKIIAISQQTADDLHTYFNVDPRKICVIYQGHNAIFHKKVTAGEVEAVRRKYMLPDSFLLTVGTIEARKNALLIVKALVRISSDIALVVVGRATKYLSRIQDFIHAQGLQHRVHFLHQVDRDDLPALYKMAKIFVYPSFFEGFGIPVVEAIACGTPVITSKGSCFAEAGGPHSRYIDPLDDKQLAEEIEEVLSNELIQREMCTQSRQYIKRFEPEQVANGLMHVYRELLA